MFYSRIVCFLETLIVAAIATNTLAVADDLLPLPANQNPARQEFPLAVKLLGYTQTPTAITVLVQIGSETETLEQGVEESVAFDELSDVDFVLFESINFKKRSILLGFPKSPYRPKICRMKSE